MKLKIALLKPPSLVEYFEEVEFQEINFFNGYFILRNGRRKKTIAHYELIEMFRNNSDDDIENKKFFYDYCPEVLTKNTPIITSKNFNDLKFVAQKNKVPMYQIFDFEDGAGERKKWFIYEPKLL
jgi:hypothetical protein